MGADEWHDPHDIIPEEFREEFGDSETVADALRRAEGRPSTTPDSERERCPFCGSLSVEQRSPRSHQLQPDLSAWKCRAEGCRRGFDSPADETTIPMTDERANPFEWIGDDEQHDPDDRTALDPPLVGIDRETALEVALRLREPWRDAEAPSYTEIARYLPYADSWVGHRVREWRDGEHRDLVPDPTAEPEPAPSNDPPIDPRAAVARIGGDYEELVAERAGSTDASSDTGAVATDGGRRSRWDAYGS